MELLRQEIEKKKEKAQILLELMHSLTVFQEFAKSKKIEDKEVSLTWLKEFITSHNLSFEKLLAGWASNAVPQPYDNKTKEEYTSAEAQKDLMQIIIKNLLRIKQIESIHPGISKHLHDNYGIQNFGRFSPETWIAQYEEREGTKPFGLVVASRNDWNGSSYNENTYEAYEDLKSNLEPDHSLRIIEAKSLPELAKLLVGIEKKYKEKPEFVIWSGHGGKEFFLGPGMHRKKGYKFFIAKDDFQGAAGERMQSYLEMFSEDTTMILDGCSDGKEDGLISTAAKSIGNKFIYPNGQTSVENFGVSKDSEGKLSFNVKYNFGIETSIAGEDNK